MNWKSYESILASIWFAVYTRSVKQAVSADTFPLHLHFPPFCCTASTHLCNRDVRPAHVRPRLAQIKLACRDGPGRLILINARYADCRTRITTLCLIRIEPRARH